MQYWINQQGVQSGPHTHEDLLKMDVSADAYVWRSGLDDWVKITTLSELEQVIGPAEVSQPEPQVVQPEPVEEVTQQFEPQPEQGSSVEEPTAESQVEEPAHQEEQQEEPAHQEEPAQQVYVAPELQQRLDEPMQYTGAQPPQVPVQGAQPRPKCPPTNLVWGIIALILCCMPPAIVTIYYSFKVKTHYELGEYEAAEKASEKGAWWCIGSIIAGLAISPIIHMLQMLGSMM
ncbi:MAG: CD225/dispanin family protein [Muribaculaceae bacterium]|nr:CD225/dispanin family protein [Muribaculaceae bacterium]